MIEMTNDAARLFLIMVSVGAISLLVIALVGLAIERRLVILNQSLAYLVDTHRHIGIDINGIRIAHVTMQGMLETDRRDKDAKQPNDKALPSGVWGAFGRSLLNRPG